MLTNKRQYSLSFIFFIFLKCYTTYTRYLYEGEFMGNHYACDKSTWNNLIDQYGDLVFRIAFQNMKNKNDAEDVAQDVYIKLLKKMPPNLNESQQKAWIIRVTINTCKDYWRFAKRHSTVEYLEELDEPKEGTPDYQIIYEVAKLPMKYRNVVFLYYYEEMSVKEISNILKKKEATILTWLHRARKQLKEIIEKGEEHV